MADVQIVMVGATGDLARRKLFPALVGLQARGHLSAGVRVVAVARRALDLEALGRELESIVPGAQRSAIAGLLQRTTSVRADAGEADSLADLAGHLDALPGGAAAQRLFYLALGPALFLPAVSNLVQAGVLARTVDPGEPCRRVLIEKPFGHSLTSARHLNEALHQLLEEEQIYRIDHYLGKETVQNLLGFRFHNAIFEPLWNRHHVELVQLTVAESIGVEHGRAAYYDGSGALRDMLQNHMLQVLSLVAMEPPISLDPQAVRDQKVQVLRGLHCPDPDQIQRATVRARYVGAAVDGQAVPGYLDEEGVPPGSHTETYVALRAEIDTWRWSGVPFILRHGKRLARRMTEVKVQFRATPLHLFNRPDDMSERELRNAIRAGTVCQTRPNVLTLSIQPEERITLSFGVKQPGPDMMMAPANLSFDYREQFGEDTAPAYERLIVDALGGDPTLFLRGDEIEASWRFADQILAGWAEAQVPMHEYPAGSWGPAAADGLFYGCEGGWSRGL